MAIEHGHRGTALSIGAALQARDIRRLEQLTIGYLCEVGEVAEAGDSAGGRGWPGLLILVAVGFGGLLLFAIPARLADALIFAAAARLGPTRDGELLVNVVRPAVSTVIVFGGGLAGMSLLGLTGLALLAGGAWFFFLTQMACLSGRAGASLRRAGWAMLMTMGSLIVLFH